MAVPNTLARWEKFRQRERLTCEVVSPRDLMRMSVEEREDYNDLRLRVIAQDRVLKTPDLHRLEVMLADLLADQMEDTSVAKHMLSVSGRSGMGKSTAVQALGRSYDRRWRRQQGRQDDVEFVPIVYVGVEPATTPKSLMQSLAAFFNLPQYDLAVTNRMTQSQTGLAQSGRKEPNEVLMRDLRPLARITAGDWFRITDLRARQHGDVLVGCFGAQVVSIYHIVGWEQQPDQTIRFEVKPAIEWSAMLGTGQPGGPWKQGEARGSRYVDSESYRERYERPTTTGRDTAAWKRLTGELALRHQGLIDRDPIPVESVDHPAHLTVEWPGIPPIGLQFTSTGILEIEVPQGLRTRVVHAKDVTASDQQIAAKLGVSVSTVRRWKRR